MIYDVTLSRFKRIVMTMIFSAFAISCSTTNSRIHEKSAAFSQANPEDQMKIQNGEIDLGYTPDMVYMAKGKPKEESTRRVDGKTILVWRYSKPQLVEPRGATGPSTGFSGAYGYPQFSGHPSAPAPMFYGGPDFVVEFEDGHVRRVVDPQ